MVPEDRKRDGIVPVMAVGKNITLAALNKFTGGISQLDDAAEQKCILESIQQLKVKTSSPRPCYWTFERRQSAKSDSRSLSIT